jgi:predicted secreted hydrolase
MKRRVLLSILVVVLAALAWWRWPSRHFEPRAALSVTNLLGGETPQGFERALAPRPFQFPADHGPHPSFRNEWWYWTGNLQAHDGRRFGYQLTFFRTGLDPHAPARSSAWAADQIYMAHLTVTDVAGQRFHAFDRFSRSALELAGARAMPFRVWLNDWTAEGTGMALAPLHLKSAREGVALELTLEQGKPVVLEGEQGLSQKGPERGNASYYYSLPRMPTRGVLTLEGERISVEGLSWMDREWGTSQLSSAQSGWDWFSLQLSDGSELMYYQLRDKSGQVDPFSRGTFVFPDGRSIALSPSDVSVAVTDHWTSPQTQVVYPSRWSLRIPSQSVNLTVTPWLSNQELNLAVRYWEGASRIEGTHSGKSVEGSGYVELTGYEHE